MKALRLWDRNYPGRIFFRPHLIEWDGEIIRVGGAGKFAKWCVRKDVKERLVDALASLPSSDPAGGES